MFCCLFIICSSSLTTLSSSCHHLFHHVSVIFLSSLSRFTIFVHGYHLHMSLSSFAIFIILRSPSYHLSWHLYRPPFLSLSSVSSFHHPPTLFVLSFCHLVHPPILFLIIFLIIVSLLVILAVVINFHQPAKIMAAFYILSDLACSFIFSSSYNIS